MLLSKLRVNVTIEVTGVTMECFFSATYDYSLKHWKRMLVVKLLLVNINWSTCLIDVGLKIRVKC